MMSKVFAKVFFTFLIAFFATTLCDSLQAQVAQAAFDRANESLESGQYQKAIREYETIYQGGYASGPLFLNLGLAYSQLDSLGMAKAWFLEARRFEETEKDATKALENVESKFSRRAAILPEMPWERLVKDQLRKVGVAGLWFQTALVFNLFVLSIVFSWYVSARYKKYGRYAAWFFLVACVVLTVNTWYAKHTKQNFQQAVCIVNNHEVLDKPTQEDATVVSLAYEGYVFRINRAKSQPEVGWYFVRMSNGVEGWIQASSVKTVGT